VFAGKGLAGVGFQAVFEGEGRVAVPELDPGFQGPGAEDQAGAEILAVAE
jgi:hypothetical protein